MKFGPETSTVYIDTTHPPTHPDGSTCLLVEGSFGGVWEVECSCFVWLPHATGPASAHPMQGNPLHTCFRNNKSYHVVFFEKDTLFKLSLKISAALDVCPD